MIYRKEVPTIVSKLTDGDEETSKTNKINNKNISLGSTGERKLRSRIGKTQNKTFDIYKKVSDRIISGVK